MFALGAIDKDGISYRETLEGLIERTRKPDRLAELEAELACPSLPEGGEHIWIAFHRLSSRRGSSGFGINPIGWPDIDAFVRLSSTRLAPWEIRIIEEIDDLFCKEQAKPKE